MPSDASGIFEIASRVSSPLALAGVFSVILLLVFRQIIAREIFPQLSAAAGAGIIKSVIDKVFLIALVAMFLGFAGWVIALTGGGDDRATRTSPEEQRVVDLRADIIALRGTYESITNPGSYAQQQVQLHAARDAEDLSSVPDERLEVGILLTKYQYVSVAYAMAADVEGRVETALRYCQEAVKTGASALEIASAVRKRAASDANTAEIAKWLSDANIEDNVRYTMAVAEAVRFRLGVPQSKSKVEGLLGEISAPFLSRYPVKDNPVFQGVLY